MTVPNFYLQNIGDKRKFFKFSMVTKRGNQAYKSDYKEIIEGSLRLKTANCHFLGVPKRDILYKGELALTIEVIPILSPPQMHP